MFDIRYYTLEAMYEMMDGRWAGKERKGMEKKGIMKARNNAVSFDPSFQHGRKTRNIFAGESVSRIWKLF